MTGRWYCRVKDQTLGPLSLQELRFLVAQGTLDSDHQIKDGKNGSWVRAGSNVELFPATTSRGGDVRKTAPTTIDALGTSALRGRAADVVAVVTPPSPEPASSAPDDPSSPILVERTSTSSIMSSPSTEERNSARIIWIGTAAVFATAIVACVAVVAITYRGRSDDNSVGRTSNVALTSGRENPATASSSVDPGATETKKRLPQLEAATPWIVHRRMAGSGFLIEHDGRLLVVTNRHVVWNCKGGIAASFRRDNAKPLTVPARVVAVHRAHCPYRRFRIEPRDPQLGGRCGNTRTPRLCPEEVGRRDGDRPSRWRGCG
jgi:hypothetical protein